MARSFQGSDGRIHYYHIQLQEGDDNDGPLVIYLPTTKCEPILHPAKSAFSLLTFEMEHVGGVPWKYIYIYIYMYTYIHIYTYIINPDQSSSIPFSQFACVNSQPIHKQCFF